MPSRHALQILLLAADPDLAELYRHECPESVVTIAKDAAAAIRKTPKRRFDAVIIESRKDWMSQVQALCEANGQAPPVVLVGAPPFLRRACETVKGFTNGRLYKRAHTKLPQDLGFDEYINAKLRDFVRRMKLGAGSDLHPLIIKAVEKPLIALVLEETNGNQNQAAALLGLNRNTLRKKIQELKIPLAKKG
ncbi:MAG: helix-turn-helix domain-containing protein [Nitrospirota bacterium]